MVTRTFAIGLLSVLAAGCDDSPCDSLYSCDIRERDCQAHVADVMACLRGAESTRPRFEVVDADAFIDERVEALDEEPLDETTLQRYRGMQLLQLMPRDLAPQTLVRNRWEDVAGFYSSETRRVTILDRGRPMDDSSSILLLAHEMVHAQQDAEDRLDPFEDQLDRDLSSSALIEGEATFYQDLAIAEAIGWDGSEVNWNHVFEEYAWSDVLRAEAEPAIYQRAGSYFAYAYGARYLGRAFTRGGVREVRRAIRKRPTSTREIVAGYGARVPGGNWKEDLSTTAQPILPAEFEHVHTEPLGAFLLELLLERVRDDRTDAWLFDPDATGCTADSASVFRTGEDGVVAFWRVRFATESHAERASTILVNDESFRVQRDARDVILAAVSDEALWQQISLDLEWGPAAEAEPEPSEDPARLRCRLSETRLKPPSPDAD